MEFVVNIKQGHSSFSHKHCEMCVNGKFDQHSSSEPRFQKNIKNPYIHTPAKLYTTRIVFDVTLLDEPSY